MRKECLRLGGATQAIEEGKCNAGNPLQVDNLNVRHRNAQLAGRASVELHTLIFFRNKNTLADARVVKVSHGLR